MMKTLIAWTVLALVIFGGVAMARHISNPFAEAGKVHFTNEQALHIPGCADHPKDCAK